MVKSKQSIKKNTPEKITTIKLDNKTKQRLEHLREHKETYNEIINKALNILNICLKNPMLANKILRDMERSRKLGSLVDNPERILKRRSNLEANLQKMKSNLNRTLNATSREINQSQKPIHNIVNNSQIPPKFQSRNINRTQN